MDERGGETATGGESTEAVWDRVTDAVFALDADWRFTHVDERAAAAFDLADREPVGRSIWLLLPELAGSGFQDRCREAMEAGRPLRIEQSFPSRGRFTMRIYPGEDGVTVCARELTEADASAAHRRRTVAETVTDAVVTVDGDGTIRRANSAAREVFGYDPAELIGEPIDLLLPDESAGRARAALERHLETGERTMDWRGVELPGRRKNGDRVELSLSLATHEVDGERRFTAVVRDVTERKRRERALRTANEVITGGGDDLDGQAEALLEVAREAIGTKFATLSQATDEEYLFDTVVAPTGAGLEAGESVPLESTNCERVIQSGETLAIDDIEAEAPALAERAGNDDTRSYLGAPVVVGDEVTGTFCVYDNEARTEPFSDWEVTFVEHLAAWVGNELERRRYVERVAALDELNHVVQEVADAAVSKPTRTEVERRTCEAIAATDSYLFAWIGEADPGSQTVESRAEAGVENYIDDVTISTDPDDPEAEGPTGRAFRTGEVQTVRNVATDPTYGPWQDSADRHGYRSSAAIPVIHEGTVYGVLNVYADRVDAFTGEEYDVVGLLGKIVGHAIASIDRRQVLLADSVVDLQFRVSDAFDAIDADLSTPHEVCLDAVVAREDDEYVVFGTTDRGGVEFVEAMVDHHPNWRELLDCREVGDGVSFEVLLSKPSLLSAISAAGGRFVETVIAGGDLQVRVQLPHDADARGLLEVVREQYGRATLVSKQEVTAADGGTRSEGGVRLDELTERRLEALRTAYHAGYFEWPRDASGEAVAELLDISPPTFSQHLRAAEEAVFAMLFEESD